MLHLSAARRALPPTDGHPDYPRLLTLRLVLSAPRPAPPPVAAEPTAQGYLRRWRSAARRARRAA